MQNKFLQTLLLTTALAVTTSAHAMEPGKGGEPAGERTTDKRVKSTQDDEPSLTAEFAGKMMTAVCKKVTPVVESFGYPLNNTVHYHFKARIPQGRVELFLTIWAPGRDLGPDWVKTPPKTPHFVKLIRKPEWMTLGPEAWWSEPEYDLDAADKEKGWEIHHALVALAPNT